MKFGHCKHTLCGHRASVFSATYTADGKSITSIAQDGTTKIWNAKTGMCDRTVFGTESVYSVTLAPDGKSYVATTGDCIARICNAETGAEERTLKGHADLVLSATFAPDRVRLAEARHG